MNDDKTTRDQAPEPNESEQHGPEAEGSQPGSPAPQSPPPPQSPESPGPEPESSDPERPEPESSAPPAASAPAEPAPPAEAGAQSGELPGSEWGFIDEEGNVRQKDNAHFPGRVIGRAKGRDPRQALGFFVDRFARLAQKADELEALYKEAENKGRFSERIDRLRMRVVKADALGDFDALLDRLDVMATEVRAFQDEQKSKKTELCEKAESLKDSTNWLKTTNALKELQAEWKRLGSASREEDDALWKRFRGALDEFFARREQDRAKRREHQDGAKKRKLELCEKAEEIKDSTDWDTTAKVQEELMAAWKEAGWAGRAHDEKLWERFRAARSHFFDAWRAQRKSFRAGLEENKNKKDALCEAAEALVESEDLYAACEQAKQLQAEWKEIGPVPRAISDAQWKRFRGACDKIFDKAAAERRSRRRETARSKDESFSRKREQAERLRESIARDRDHVERWRRALDGLSGDSGSPLRQGLEEKITSVESRLSEKQESLKELETEIRQEQ